MKVALVVPGGLDRSGTERVIPALLWLIERLSRHVEVHAFALAPNGRSERYPLRGATVHAIGAGLRPARAAAAIAREHRRGPFHVLHAFWATRCGSIVVPHGRALGVPTIVHLAGGETAALPAIGYGDARTARGRALLRRVLRGADLVTAPSDPIVQAATALGCTAVRLPLGVDREAWPVAPPRPRDPQAPARLVHVASMNRVKDPFTLFGALAHLSPSHPFELDVVGEDVLAGEAEAAAGHHGLRDRVRFHGFLPQQALRPLVLAADMFVMSSLHEAGPIAALEAAHSGLAIAGTAVGHLAEWAPAAASVAPPGDVVRLAGAIARVISDEPLRLDLAAEVQGRAVREDADVTAAAILERYGDLSHAPAELA